jgi:DNA repair exonuclease SbcCD nuclease subunit
VVVATLPWAPMSTLTAKFDGNRDAMHDHAIGALVHAAHFLSARCREEYPGVPSVLVGHWAISGAALPTGLSTDILKEVIVPLEDLRDAGYSMVAFGHIHKPQVLSGDPPIIFCGSPWVMNWGEAGHDHGMWLYDTQGVLDFIPIPDKRFVTIDTDLLGIANGEWDQWSVDGAFVRLRWEMSEEAARSLDLNELRGHIERANALRVILQPRIISDQKARVVEMTEDLTLDESFRMWVESQDVDDTQALNDAHSEFVARVR